jgi:O-antigen/teichoic acid export membrane protein
MSISKNTAYNIAGSLLPVAITLVTVPLYLEVVGIERYGALTICWIVLGYLGFLDLGLGPAVAQKIASTRDDPGSAVGIFWTAIWTSFAMGVLGSLLLCAGAALYFTAAGFGSNIEREIADAIPLLGAILPVVMVSSVASGALSGRERFLTINLITSFSATLMSLLPLLFAYLWGPSVSILLAGALVARTVGMVLAFRSSAKELAVSKPQKPSRELIMPLLKFGGWVTISTAVAPLLLTVDRLAIGALIGAGAVAAYSIPFSLIARLGILPGSLSSALYPRFAAGLPEDRTRLAGLGLAVSAAVMTPACVFTALLVDPFFKLWIGPELAAVCAPVTYALIFGTWTNSLAFVPYSLLQGSGRPEVVSKIHLAEILPYWAVLAGGILLLGLPGAALAWTVRTTADCALLFWRSGLGLSPIRPLLAPLLLVLAAVLIAAFLPLPSRYFAGILILLLTGVWGFLTMPAPLRDMISRVKSLSLVLRRSDPTNRLG